MCPSHHPSTYPLIGWYVDAQWTPVLQEATSVEDNIFQRVGLEVVDGSSKTAGVVVSECDLGPRDGKELGGREEWGGFVCTSCANMCVLA